MSDDPLPFRNDAERDAWLLYWKNLRAAFDERTFSTCCLRFNNRTLLHCARPKHHLRGSCRGNQQFENWLMDFVKHPAHLEEYVRICPLPLSDVNG